MRFCYATPENILRTYVEKGVNIAPVLYWKIRTFFIPTKKLSLGIYTMKYKRFGTKMLIMKIEKDLNSIGEKR